MSIPKDLKYTKSHEWVKFLENGVVEIGLTDYAQKELGDIVFVNLPLEGDAITVEMSFSDVESVKAVSDVFSPVTGLVKEINTELMDHPERVNSSPYESWLVRVVDVTQQEELLSPEDYEKLISEEA